MSRLTRDGTAEPVPRDQIIRHVRGQGNIHFPCSTDHEWIGNLTRLIHTLLYVMTIHSIIVYYYYNGFVLFLYYNGFVLFLSGVPAWRLM